MSKKVAIIAGAGPAGLTAAYELLKRTDIRPIVYEATDAIGGIAQTYNYKCNRIDIGGHRFFSKSDRVMQWWFNILPPQGKPAADDIEKGHEVEYAVDGMDGEGRPRHASAFQGVLHFLSEEFFPLSHWHYPHGRAEAGASEYHSHRSFVRLATAVSHEGRNIPRCLLSEPLRRPPLQDVLRGVHGKGVGSALQSDPCGLGGAAGEGALSQEGTAPCSERPRQQRFSEGAAGVRDEPHHAVLLPEVRPGADVGNSDRAHSAVWRGGGTEKTGCWSEDAERRKPTCHAEKKFFSG